MYNNIEHILLSIITSLTEIIKNEERKKKKSGEDGTEIWKPILTIYQETPKNEQLGST